MYSDSFTVNFPQNNVDPGPSAGRLPTDPFLVNGPVVNRALLNTMFPAGTQQKNSGTVQFDNPNRRLPYTQQASVGYERQLTGVMAVSVDYIRNDLKDLYLRQDLNPGLRDSTARTATVRRPDGSVAQVLEITNLGWANSNSMQVSLTKRQSHGYQYRMAYTLSNTFANVPSPGVVDTVTTQLGTDLNLEEGEARTTQDRPHVLSASGSVEVPKTRGLVVSAGIQYQSGTPYTLTDSTLDNDCNGQFQELLPAGTYSGASTNSDAITVENEGGFRGVRGPDFMLLNLRAGYRFRLRGGHALQAHFDVFNLTNRANFNNPTGDRRDTATFLIFRSVTAPTRTAQFNLKYTF